MIFNEWELGWVEVEKGGTLDLCGWNRTCGDGSFTLNVLWYLMNKTRQRKGKLWKVMDSKSFTLSKKKNSTFFS